MDYQLQQTGPEVQEILNQAPGVIVASALDTLATKGAFFVKNEGGDVTGILLCYQDEDAFVQCYIHEGILFIRVGSSLPITSEWTSIMQVQINALQEGKVNKREGYGLSQNDFTDYYKGSITSLMTTVANLDRKISELSGIKKINVSMMDGLINESDEGFYDVDGNGNRYLAQMFRDGSVAYQWVVEPHSGKILVRRYHTQDSTPAWSDFVDAYSDKQDTISDLSTIRSGAAAGATAIQPAALTPIQDAINTIEAVIPSAASAQNQLADKSYVDNKVSSSTANFVGTYESLAELQAVQNPTNNDYGFVIEKDALGNEYYDRYKFNGTEWMFEYKVESTSFTADQWAAIQSGITSALVTKLNALPTAQQINTQLAGKQEKITTVNVNVDNSTGTPSGSASVNGSTLTINLSNIKGATNAPDEEDLTSEKQGDTDILKFKDKAYNSAAFSGLGRVHLRKNLSGGKNIITQAMVNKSNTIYHIQYDYDLNGETITLPAGCVLEFKGGSIGNGTIIFNGTIIKADGIAFKSNITISASSTLAGDVKVGWFAGVENDSVKLNTLLNSGADNIYLDKIVYHVHGTQRVQDEEMVDSQDNTYRKYNIGSEWLFCLLLNEVTSKIHWNGATLQQDAETNDSAPIIGLINCHNFVIKDLTIIGDKLIHLGTTGQWSHGIAILPDCSDIEVFNVSISQNYGDGICLLNNSNNTEQATFYAKNISIHDCIFGNTIRNNISVISGENIDIRNNIFRRIDSDLNADGTALVTDCHAHLFVDMEVNFMWQTIKNVTIENNSMYSNKIAINNTSGGVSFSQKGIVDNVNVIGNTIENCYYYEIAWGSNIPSATFFIEGNRLVGNSLYGGLYCVTKTHSYVRNNTFIGTKIGYLGNDNFNTGSENIKFPISSQLNIYDCLFVDTPASSVYVANFFGCRFVNAESLEVRTTKFVNCYFKNCGQISLLSFYDMTASDKATALQNKEIIESYGFVVGEDGSTYLAHDGNEFNGCTFVGNSDDINPLLLNNALYDPFVLRDTSMRDVKTSAYIIRSQTNQEPIIFDGVIFDNISSSIFTTNATITNTDILFRKVTITNISVEASSLRPIYIGNAKSVLFDRFNIEYSELYNETTTTKNIQILDNSVAEIKNAIINTKLASRRDIVLNSYKSAFATLQNINVNGIAFFTDAAGVQGSRLAAPVIGMCYFNTTNGKPMWWNGTNWVDATGIVVV